MASTTPIERSGAITFKGNPMTLLGPELKVGDKAPDFHLVTADLKPVTFADLSENGTKTVLMILVPSIDTSVCSLETGKFNRQVTSLPAGKVKVVTISNDTPFAQKRWATQEMVDNIELLSDHKDRTFSIDYGMHIKELGLFARAIFVVDKHGIIRYIQTVREVALEPDYDAVLKAARDIASE